MFTVISEKMNTEFEQRLKTLNKRLFNEFIYIINFPAIVYTFDDYVDWIYLYNVTKFDTDKFEDYYEMGEFLHKLRR